MTCSFCTTSDEKLIEKRAPIAKGILHGATICTFCIMRLNNVVIKYYIEALEQQKQTTLNGIDQAFEKLQDLIDNEDVEKIKIYIKNKCRLL